MDNFVKENFQRKRETDRQYAIKISQGDPQ